MPLIFVEGASAQSQVAPRLEGESIVAPFAPASRSPRPLAGADDLIYCGLLGGGDTDWGYGLAVDGAGSAYLVGSTFSADFPATPGAFDVSANGLYDVFVAKVNPAGSALDYVTFIGGRYYDRGYAIAVDREGRAIIGGETNSDDFPTTPGAFNRAPRGGWDGFVARLSADGSALEYATLLGGRGDDTIYALALEDSGRVALTGSTTSPDWPLSASALDRGYGGQGDAFVAKLDAQGASLVCSTFLGGSDWDIGLGIAAHGSGDVFVTGSTLSWNFPKTPKAFDPGHSGHHDAFVTRISSDGQALLYSSYLGGINYDVGYAIAVDADGYAYVAGQTISPDFPINPA